jgi:hypothetical protein
LVSHLGAVYNIVGIYFLLRIFCSSLEDVVQLCRVTALVLLPVALEMAYEQITLHNLFSMFGGVPAAPQFRDGRFRAFGPFAHPILAGTVGGVTLPLMLGVWRYHKLAAAAGIAACVTIVFASASSGPLMSALISLGAIGFWRLRHHMRLMRWTLLAVYVALLVVMERPPYYIIQRLEVVGGSTGWYRSRLIESSIEHLGEWWLAGTDYTRHWMVDANAISATHTDITNHYLALGVMGGLPLLLLFIVCLVKGFSIVGRAMRQSAAASPEREFMLWAFGCSLVAHTISSISVSYFDQSVLFLYLTLAVIASVGSGRSQLPARSEAAVRESGNPTRWGARVASPAGFPKLSAAQGGSTREQRQVTWRGPNAATLLWHRRGRIF